MSRDRVDIAIIIMAIDGLTLATATDVSGLFALAAVVLGFTLAGIGCRHGRT